MQNMQNILYLFNSSKTRIIVDIYLEVNSFDLSVWLDMHIVFHEFF